MRELGANTRHSFLCRTGTSCNTGLHTTRPTTRQFRIPVCVGLRLIWSCFLCTGTYTWTPDACQFIHKHSVRRRKVTDGRCRTDENAEPTTILCRDEPVILHRDRVQGQTTNKGDVSCSSAGEPGRNVGDSYVRVRPGDGAITNLFIAIK